MTEYIDAPLYVLLSNEQGDDGDWIRADLYFNHQIVASGRAPERPPYIDGTARSSAISLAQSEFHLKVLSKAPTYAKPGFKEKEVKGRA